MRARKQACPVFGPRKGNRTLPVQTHPHGRAWEWQCQAGARRPERWSRVEQRRAGRRWSGQSWGSSKFEWRSSKEVRSSNTEDRGSERTTLGSPKSERRSSKEVRMAKFETGAFCTSSFVLRISFALRIYHHFLQIAPKIRFSSLASRQRRRASSLSSGSALATMRRKNMVSLDSFREVPTLCLNSFLETASCASQ